MSLLQEIQNRVVAKGRAEESWLVLRNAYFREGNGWDAMKKWADSVDILFTSEETSGASGTKDFRITFFNRNAV